MGFENPHGPELLAHGSLGRQHEEPVAPTAERAVETVHTRSARKKKLVTADHIWLAWQRLNDSGALDQ